MGVRHFCKEDNSSKNTDCSLKTELWVVYRKRCKRKKFNAQVKNTITVVEMPQGNCQLAKRGVR
jgi:hypothetical protein